MFLSGIFGFHPDTWRFSFAILRLRNKLKQLFEATNDEEVPRWADFFSDVALWGDVSTFVSLLKQPLVGDFLLCWSTGP